MVFGMSMYAIVAGILMLILVGIVHWHLADCIEPTLLADRW
jgi:hypothetical protein